MSRENSAYMKSILKQRQILIGKWMRRRVHLLALPVMLILIGVAFLTPVLFGAHATSQEQFTSGGDWITYGYDNAHDSFNSSETIITPSTAPQLKQKWAHPAGNGISDQAAIVNGVAYYGSWDGYAHATNVSNNARIWSTFIGQTTDSSCNPPRVGVAGTTTVVTVNGKLEVLVGGGDANFYALDASSGHVLWKTALGSPPNTFLWSSPAIYQGSIYMGVSSFGDCPLIQGELVQMDVTSGAIQHTFPLVPNKCTGGSLWGSPTIDENAGTIFMAVGNTGSCSSAEPYAFALVEVNAGDLSFVNSWQIPAAQRPGDSDFGSTPTLFKSSTGTLMVGVANKNGIYYAFNRLSIGGGPVWQKQIANTGDCPQCGSGSISPSAFDGHTLYVAGGNTTIGSTSCKGSVRAVNPDNGSFIWEHCMGNGPVLGAVTVAGATQSTEVLAVGQGNTIIVMNASTGATVARLSDNLSGSTLYGPVTISNGVLYVGNIDGNLYSYSINGQ